MKIDFDIENIKMNKLELLNCQVDLIMRSLEMYAYMYRFAYPRKNGKFESKEEEMRVSLVIDTYEQILSQYNYKSNFKNIYTDEIFRDLEQRKKYYKKIS